MSAGSIFARARSWYGRYERPLSSFSLIGGFVFDALTLHRVDMFWENFWVVAHLTIVTVCAIWLNILDDTADESGVRPEANPQKLRFWLVNVMQFFFGGILSTYLVFYFRSSAITASWPFLLLLAAAFVANESLKRHYARISFQISLLFLAYYAFAIYLVPILLHRIGPWIFILSGVVSVAAIRVLFFIFRIILRENFTARSRRLAVAAIVFILAGVNTLYFLNLIPPLPLSLEDGAVYHSLVANGPGNYTVTSEKHGFDLFGLLNWDQTTHIVAGDALYAYTAVFSPTALNTDIVHEWQYYDQAKGIWSTRSRIALSVVGGNERGYRTFSTISYVTPGEWRVNVETPDGGVIGQLRFDVVQSQTEPPLETQTID